MFHEPDVLEARQIADLAADARRVRDRLLEKEPDGKLGEPMSGAGRTQPWQDSRAEWRVGGGAGIDSSGHRGTAPRRPRKAVARRTGWPRWRHDFGLG